MSRHGVSTPFPGRREMDEGSLGPAIVCLDASKGHLFRSREPQGVDAASTRRKYGCRINGGAALNIKEQNPDLTGRDRRAMVTSRFVTAATVPDLVSRMNALTGGDPRLSAEGIRAQVLARDADATRRFGKDPQAAAIRRARAYLGDRLMRVARPHALLDPAAGPLIAVRLHVLTRKTLGGLHTDLSSRVLSASGEPVPGLYAAGEAAGFGGGGMHGYRSVGVNRGVEDRERVARRRNRVTLFPAARPAGIRAWQVSGAESEGCTMGPDPRPRDVVEAAFRLPFAAELNLLYVRERTDRTVVTVQCDLG
jgi:FAD binding domain